MESFFSLKISLVIHIVWSQQSAGGKQTLIKPLMFLCLCRMNKWPVVELPEKGLTETSSLVHTRLHEPLSVFTSILYPPYWELHVWDVPPLHCVQATCRGFGMGRHCIGKKGEKILWKWERKLHGLFFAVASPLIASNSQFFARQHLSSDFFFSDNKHDFFCSSLREKCDTFPWQFQSLKILTDPNPKCGARYFPRKSHRGENTLTLFFSTYN